MTLERNTAENNASARPPEVSVKVVSHKGGMSLEVDGKIQPFTSFKINENSNSEIMLDAARAEIPGIAKEGIHLCWVPIFIDWTGPGQYNFDDMDLRIQTVLDLYDQHAAPDTPPALVVVRIQAAVFLPEWIVQQAADADGNASNLIEFRNPWATVDSCRPEDVGHQRYATEMKGRGSTLAISPGDPFWDTHAVDCLQAIVDHVRSSSYAHRVFGWLPCAFNTNEWFLRTFAHEASCDFSAPTQKAFREHLQAMGIPCEDEPVPSALACHTPGHGEFLDPTSPEARRVEEFSLWLNRRFAEIIIRFAEVIKTAYADRPKLVGFFYGYTLGLSRLNNLSQCGQLGLGRVLECDAIDFICSPGEYFSRGDEKPFTTSMVMGPFANSAAYRNKLFFLEDDHRPAGAGVGGAAFSTRDPWHDEMFLRRNFAYVWSHGQQLWWYSLGANWFKDPARQKVVGTLQAVGEQALKRSRKSVAEIAVVIDERSISTMRFHPTFQQRILTESHAEFFPTGAPFETFELQSFLRDTDPSQFNVVVFLNLFRVDAHILAAVNKLKSDNRTLLFSFAAGLLQDTNGKRHFSTDSASELIGMQVAEEPEPIPQTVWVDPERTSLMPDGEDLRYGWLDIDIGVEPPILGIVDSDVEALGFLHSGRPGLGRKKHDGWTSVFSSAPGLPFDLLRELLRNAGVHLYTEEGDTVYANESMIACSASSRGTKTLRLPDTDHLIDVLDGTVLKLDTHGQTSISMKRHETRIFWRETS